MQIKLVMNLEQADFLVQALETVARIGMFQFDNMVEIISPKSKYDDVAEITNFIRETIQKRRDETNNSISSVATPEVCRVAWDAYQHLRREVSWYRKGLDWRVDERKMSEPDGMYTVNYDNPMKVSRTNGVFKTELIK